MPYISAKESKEIREKLKAALPNYKISVSIQHFSKLCVAILSGPLDFQTINSDVFQYSYKEQFQSNPEAIKVFDSILECINGVKKEEIITRDGDYGDVPNFYIDISIGKYGKNYILINSSN